MLISYEYTNYMLVAFIIIHKDVRKQNKIFKIEITAVYNTERKLAIR